MITATSTGSDSYRLLTVAGTVSGRGRPRVQCSVFNGYSAVRSYIIRAYWSYICQLCTPPACPMAVRSYIIRAYWLYYDCFVQ